MQKVFHPADRKAEHLLFTPLRQSGHGDQTDH
jgi:hypothetical protein